MEKEKYYTLYADAGHSWLAVPTKDLIASGVHTEISPFSFMSPSGKMVYLEEDCDASRFGEQVKKLGWERKIVYDYKNRQSRIRNLQSYQWK